MARVAVDGVGAALETRPLADHYAAIMAMLDESTSPSLASPADLDRRAKDSGHVVIVDGVGLDDLHRRR